MKRRGALLSAVLLGGCSRHDASVSARDVIRVPGSLEGLPFSPAVRGDGMRYLSGQISTPPAATGR